jgi:hypothetical protein
LLSSFLPSAGFFFRPSNSPMRSAVVVDVVLLTAAGGRMILDGAKACVEVDANRTAATTTTTRVRKRLFIIGARAMVVDDGGVLMFVCFVDGNVTCVSLLVERKIVCRVLSVGRREQRVPNKHGDDEQKRNSLLDGTHSDGGICFVTLKKLLRIPIIPSTMQQTLDWSFRNSLSRRRKSNGTGLDQPS